jgi:hypothetical protein
MAGSNDRLPYYYRSPTVITPPGTYFYKEVRRLQSIQNQPLSLYPGYPIFHLYKQIRDSGTTIETRVGALEYWKPVETLAHIVYEENDENSLASIRDTEVPLAKTDKRKKLWAEDWEPFKHSFFGGKVFIATNKFADVFGSNQNKNPYSYRLIRLWVLHPDYDNFSFLDDEGQRRISYFYAHPQILSIGRNTITYNLPFYSLPKNLTYSLSSLEEIKTAQEEIISENSLSNAVVTSDSVRTSVVESLIEYAHNELGKTKEQAVKYANTVVKKITDSNGDQVLARPYENGLSRTTVTVTRSTFGGRSGYVSPAVSVSSGSQPQMVQQYRVEGTGAPVTNRHIFQFKPNQVSYSGMGSEWTEIPRTGNVPLVDWKSYKLLQVTFQFLVAPDDNGSLDDTTDGKKITLSIDDKIRILRKMAVTPYPVYLLGFDEILAQQMRFPFNAGRGVEFVIAEFNVTSLMRTDSGEINRAQCDITLREIPIDSVKLIDFPKISFQGIAAEKKARKKEDQDGINPLWTATVAGQQSGGGRGAVPGT